MIKSNCRIENCKDPVHGAIHMPVWKKSKKGKVITNINGKPILEGYELWHYCKKHYELYDAVNKTLDKTIETLNRIAEQRINERGESINDLFSLYPDKKK